MTFGGYDNTLNPVMLDCCLAQGYWTLMVTAF